MHDASLIDRRPAAEATKLEMRWVPVTDEWGHARMVATWIDSSATSPVTHRAA